MSALPRPEEDLRLVVAMAAHGDRYQALLRAYLNGPGRGMFVVSDQAHAQALIADYDHPTSRAEMKRYLVEQRRPVIVLATRDPGLPGTVWVRKPVDFDTLATAAHRVWTMLSAVPSPAPASWRWLPRSVGGEAVPPGNGRRPREEPGPYRTPPRDDWTAKIAATTLGLLGIAALASMLGWQPSAQSLRPPTEPEHEASGAAELTRRALTLAVRESLQEPRRTSAVDRTAVDAQLRELAQVKPLPEMPAAFQLRSIDSESVSASPMALPIDQLADALVADPQAELRQAIAAAVQAALAGRSGRSVR